MFQGCAHVDCISNSAVKLPVQWHTHTCTQTNVHVLCLSLSCVSPVLHMHSRPCPPNVLHGYRRRCLRCRLRRTLYCCTRFYTLPQVLWSVRDASVLHMYTPLLQRASALGALVQVHVTGAAISSASGDAVKPEWRMLDTMMQATDGSGKTTPGSASATVSTGAPLLCPCTTHMQTALRPHLVLFDAVYVCSAAKRCICAGGQPSSLAPRTTLTHTNVRMLVTRFVRALPQQAAPLQQHRTPPPPAARCLGALAPPCTPGSAAPSSSTLHWPAVYSDFWPAVRSSTRTRTWTMCGPPPPTSPTQTRCVHRSAAQTIPCVNIGADQQLRAAARPDLQ
jgi:hypothetical protein